MTLVIQELPFPDNIRDIDYQVFPTELESNPDVLFHGTSCDAFEMILCEGFKGTKDLESVSFARQSSLSLFYACNPNGNGVIVAVRFNSQRGVRHEHSIVYLDDIENQPEIVGYCRIPNTYRHV